MDPVRALVADDHPVVRSAICQYLRSLGVTVAGEAANGEEAVELARSLRPDLVILDGHMPELSGYEAARSIRATLHTARIAIVSVSQDEAYARSARAHAADTFIPKYRLKDAIADFVAAVRHPRANAAVGAAA